MDGIYGIIVRYNAQIWRVIWFWFDEGWLASWIASQPARMRLNGVACCLEAKTIESDVW